MKKLLMLVAAVSMLVCAVSLTAFADGNEATIGDISYPTLKAAFEAAKGGEEIVLTGDVEISESLVNSKDIVLDLNGFTIAGNFEKSGSTVVIQNNGTLTVKDSSVVKTGKITSHAVNPDTQEIPGYASNTINNAGTFTLESGTIENTTSSGGACYAIDTSWYTKDVLTTINGGKVVATNTAVRICSYSTVADNKLVINGGEITGSATGVWLHLPGNKNEKKKITVDINNGKISATGENGYAMYTYSFGDAFDGVEVDISGGQFTGWVGFGSGTGSGAEKVRISGGKFNLYPYVFSATKDIEITGGTYGYEPGYLADGYEAVLNAEGAYEVDKESEVPATIDAAKNEDGSASVAINAGFDNYEVSAEDTKTFGVYIYKQGTKLGKKVSLAEGNGNLAENSGLFNVVVSNIPETEFNTVLVCVPFVVVGEETILGNAKAISAGSLLGIN